MTDAASTTTTPATTAGALGALSRVKESAQHVLGQQRPMSEILDVSTYARPLSFGDATSRMQKNLNYFRINYLVFMSCVLTTFILFNPSSMVVFGGVSAAWAYVFSVRQEPLKLGDRELSHRETIMGMSALSAFVIFMLTSAGTVLFSGMGVALLAIGAHSAARVPDDLFIEDANDNKGFFSFLEPPARNGQVSSGTV
jgi:PRA1 family protein 1